MEQNKPKLKEFLYDNTGRIIIILDNTSSKENQELELIYTPFMKDDEFEINLLDEKNEKICVFEGDKEHLEDIINKINNLLSYIKNE